MSSAVHCLGRAQLAMQLLSCTLAAISYVVWPRALGAEAGGLLEVGGLACSSSNKVRGRGTRGGKLAAMVDGSVQGSASAIGIWYEQGHPLNFSRRINGPADNNRAELAAVFWALLRHPRSEVLTLYTDNTHVLARLRTAASVGPGEFACVLSWAIALLVFLRTARTLVKKVKAHSGNHAHDMADSLAKISTRSETVTAVPEGECLSLWGRLQLLLFTFVWELREPFVSFCCSLGLRVSDLQANQMVPAVLAQTGSRAGRDSESNSKNKTSALRAPQPINDDHSLTRFIGIDCEMVGIGATGDDSALARVCLVNQYGNILMDEYALPEEPITDYRTPFSGIRPKDLVKAPPVREVQARVAELAKGHVLVGHGLENDLAVLNLRRHPPSDTRDTAKISMFCYRQKRGRPRKLRDLAQFHLGLRIQQGEHSPVDDARAAMYLFKAFEHGSLRRKLSSGMA